MEKRKSWQLVLILLVIVATLINVMPTVLYYSQPLKDPISDARAESVAHDIASRVNDLQDDAVNWLIAFNKHLKIKTKTIETVPNNPALIQLTFENEKDVSRFRNGLPKAGSLIPFAPSQLRLSPQPANDPTRQVLVQRPIGIHLPESTESELFTYSAKWDSEGNVTPFYQDLIFDRMGQLTARLAGPSRQSQLIEYMSKNPNTAASRDIALSLAKDLVTNVRVFGENAAISQRLFASYSQGDSDTPANLTHTLISGFETAKSRLSEQQESIVKEQKEQQEKGGFADLSKEDLLPTIARQIATLEKAVAIVRSQDKAFRSGETPLTEANIIERLKEGKAEIGEVQTLDISKLHPFVASVSIDWGNDQITLNLNKDVDTLLEMDTTTEEGAIRQERLNLLVIEEMARLARVTEETINPLGRDYAIQLNSLTNSNSLLALDLGALSKQQASQLTDYIKESWKPTHRDLTREEFPIRTYTEYEALSSQEQRLGLVVYTPSMSDKQASAGFQPGSLYVIARGLNQVMEKYQSQSNSAEAHAFMQDFDALARLLDNSGYRGYSGASYGIDPEYRNDFIFAMDNAHLNLLLATREEFSVKGSQRYATLEFTNLEQRLHIQNNIDDAIHENLLKWKEEYGRAQVDMDPAKKFTVPPPTKSPIWENFKLTTKKYFRGDDRKVLKWGLDLSGGKTVRIGLLDQSNQRVTNEADLKQAVNELYSRINKMGVSEQTIRIEGSHILIEFPGAQGLTASELVKGSTMTFHMVNEAFVGNNPELNETVQRFLQGVWNEAVVTNRKDSESINQIAWQHLGGDMEDGVSVTPRTEEAKLLYEAGLRLPSPQNGVITHDFNDTESMIAMRRGEEPADWRGAPHPLIVVFRNYALAGSSLQSVQPTYDPGKGHMLHFGVGSSYLSKDQVGSPRDDFYAWTSKYSQDKVSGTPLEKFSRQPNGKTYGWRMAVILNGQVISDPQLGAPLRDGGTISGNFSQREISRLAADLKAGSLSFTPKILAETNISADLGQTERSRGIMASLFGLSLIVVTMVGYYRFAGIVASAALLLNLLIMWGVLQNLDAALTLPGLAGIILAVGMAVDANVLVFERIREEFATSGRIATAIQAGYRKAFSAIIDSNITTIAAAVILLQFDAGPIKGFATTLIIGIVCSMFTALFVTRYFFAGWVQKAQNKTLYMMDLVGKPNFDFLGKAKALAVVNIVIIMIGSYLLVDQSSTIFGMEFTGGHSLTVEVEEVAGMDDYREVAEAALEKSGANPTDFQVKKLNRANQLKIDFGTGMQEEERPFHELSDSIALDSFTYNYETNPQLVWVVKALENGGMEIKESQLENLDQHWSVMSGQFSTVMRDQAIMALGLAMLAILIYITLRFEFKYGISAIVALTHDVAISLGLLAILHYFGAPLQITMEIVGALMTIIGYSLNDTIIIFDRIREDVRLHRKMKFRDIVHRAINETLSRTLITSGTTALVLLTLVLLGGQAIFAFSFIMLMGVVFGTASSLFIACPVMLYFHRREEQKNHVQLKTS